MDVGVGSAVQQGVDELVVAPVGICWVTIGGQLIAANRAIIVHVVARSQT